MTTTPAVAVFGGLSPEPNIHRSFWGQLLTDHVPESGQLLYLNRQPDEALLAIAKHRGHFIADQDARIEELEHQLGESSHMIVTLRLKVAALERWIKEKE